MDLMRCLTVGGLTTLVACGEAEPARSPLRDASSDSAAPGLDAGTDSGNFWIDAGLDARIDSGTYWNDAGVQCCMPSPVPACCMRFGGAKDPLGGCAYACDGMPAPSDPAWRLVNDAFGCPTWSSKGATGPCCGSAPAPADASTPYDFMCYPDL